jgi:hypothetical protein
MMRPADDYLVITINRMGHGLGMIGFDIIERIRGHFEQLGITLVAPGGQRDGRSRSSAIWCRLRHLDASTAYITQFGS